MAPEYPDDTTIDDASILWRRIHPDWVVTDENRGGVRVTSLAFNNSSDGSPTSVHLEEVAREYGITAECDPELLCRIPDGLSHGRALPILQPGCASRSNPKRSHSWIGLGPENEKCQETTRRRV